MTAPHPLFAALSDAIAGIVAETARSVAAIRIGPNRTVTGLLWGDGRLVTSDQALPAQNGYSVVLSSGAMIPAQPGPRDPSTNLAMLYLDTAVPAPLSLAARDPAVGALVLVLGASFDGSPAARLAMVHRLVPSAGTDMPTIMLDIAGGQAERGSIVLDASGGLIGMASVGPARETAVIHSVLMTRFAGQSAERAPLAPLAPVAVPPPVVGPPRTGFAPVSPPLPRPAPELPRPVPVPSRASVATGARRGWLGVALQPITVPEGMVAKAGQTSGRMVVNVTPGGPAEHAGLSVGDVVLSLNGHSATGSHAFRAWLAEEKIGSQIEIRVLRDGQFRTVYLTVAEQPT